MSDEHKVLSDRIAALEARVAELGVFLHSALAYLSSDPASSLTKSRVTLEKVLIVLYRGAMKKEPSRPMIGDMLGEKAFMATVPRRIAARMNSIREMSNLGPHGEEVDAADAIRVMRDLIDVLEWYVVHHDPSCRISGGREPTQSLEILPQLLERYPRYLRRELTSVKFVQSQDCCYLELTTAERVNEYLVDETSKRTDLAFISNDSGIDDPSFLARGGRSPRTFTASFRISMWCRSSTALTCSPSRQRPVSTPCGSNMAPYWITHYCGAWVRDRALRRPNEHDAVPKFRSFAALPAAELCR
jgi:Domain of unknown function (DUF4145)